MLKTNAPSPLRAFWGHSHNFGDALTPWLLEKLLGVKIELSQPSKEYSAIKGIGSIIASKNQNMIVWGAGTAEQVTISDRPRRVCALRGPITGECCASSGIMDPKIYGDPCLLLPHVQWAGRDKKYELGIIPHYVDQDSDWLQNVKDRDDILVINICGGIEQVISQTTSCKRIVSSSLHGLILADAYGIPSLWCEFSDKLWGDGTKFRDHMLAIDTEPYSPLQLRSRDDVSNIDELIDMPAIRKVPPTIADNLKRALVDAVEEYNFANQ